MDVTTRDIVVAGALPRHQMRQYLNALQVEWSESAGISGKTYFTVTATEAQWGQIQEWVKKVTG